MSDSHLQPQLGSHQQAPDATPSQQGSLNGQLAEGEEHGHELPHQATNSTDRQLQPVLRMPAEVQSSRDATTVANGQSGVVTERAVVKKSRQRKRSPLPQAGKVQKSRGVEKQAAAPVRRSQRDARLMQLVNSQ